VVIKEKKKFRYSKWEKHENKWKANMHKI